MTLYKKHAGRFLYFLIILPFFFGCSQTRFMVKSMNPLMAKMNKSVNENPDVDTVRDAMPASLIQMDGFITAAPNKELLLMTSEAYFGYSFAFIEDADKVRASKMYLKARDYALQVLNKDSHFKKALNKPAAGFKQALKRFDKDDVPALYWAASSWMARIALNLDKPELLMDIPKAEAMLLRVVELDENFYYGVAHAALGSFYASRSKTIGGDPEKAKYHFDRAFELSDSKILFVHLMYAKFYAYQVQDRQLFISTLEDIVSKPVGYFPEKNFANEVAKRKAKRLLEDVDMYF